MRLIAFLLFLTPTVALAECICSCVNGQVQPICSTAIEVRPVCGPRVCPIVPPSVQPIPAPRVPPIGTSKCGPKQVWNPSTGMYEWRVICS